MQDCKFLVGNRLVIGSHSAHVDFKIHWISSQRHLKIKMKKYLDDYINCLGIIKNLPLK